MTNIEYSPEASRSQEAPRGLLFSQIGYDLGFPMRAIVCGPREMLQNPTFEIKDENGEIVLSGDVQPWGEKWRSFWWTIDFSSLRKSGNYTLRVLDNEVETFRGSFEIGPNLLWDKTAFLVSIDQAERRARLAKHKVGWQDCGTNFQELNSHAAYIIGLLDVLEHARHKLSNDEVLRLKKQIINGCALLELYADEAQKHGFPSGALIHELPKFENDVLPPDVAQSAVCFARAARLLSNKDCKTKYTDARRKV